MCCVASSRCTCLGLVRRVGVAYDRSIGRRVMARYLFRRQWGAKTETEMLEGALRSKRIGRDFDDITWDHSHVVADADGNVLSYCIYEAPSADLVLDHAALVGGHFVDQVMDLDADLHAHESVTPLAADDPARRWMVVRSWSDLDRRQIGDAVHRAARTAHDITWEHTHIGSDEEEQLRTHGVYRATDDATIRRFAEEPSAAEVTDLYEIAGDVRPEDLED